MTARPARFFVLLQLLDLLLLTKKMKKNAPKFWYVRKKQYLCNVKQKETKNMKQTTINVQITKNLGNYESIRLGGEWSIEDDDPAQAYRDALNELNGVYKQLFHVEQKVTEKPQEQAPKPQPKMVDGKQCISFKDDAGIVQSICRRVASDKAVTMETIGQYYVLDDEARKVVELAIKMRG